MKKFFILFIILQVAVIFLFYPDFYGIYDEDLYLTATHAMQNGSFFYEKSGVDAPLLGAVEGTKGAVSIYPPGNSVLLLPFTVIHWKLGFLKNILLYIGSFLLFISILRKLKIDPMYSLVFLLHPTIVLFSRTLMSDIPSMFFLLVGVLLLLDKKNLGAGFSLGFLLLLRYPNVILIIGIFGALLYRKEYKKSLRLLPGIVFFSFALFGYVMHVYGSILGPFAVDGARSFGFSYFIYNFPYYLLSLNVLFPGMLLIAIFFGFKNKKSFLFIIPSLLIIIFYSFYYYIDGGSNIIEKLVKGQRFMIPVIPLLLIPYLQFFHNRKFMKKVFVFVVPLLFIFACGIHYKHYEFVKKEKILSQTVRENIGDSDVVICNSDTDELFNPYFSNVKLIELSEIDKDKLDFLRKNYNISFIFVELKRGRLYEEKQGWIEFFKNEGFEISYESEEPVPVIVMSE
ncbi:MAG: hypothetical protein P8Y62_01785 [candidate division WOR-3 bacterium]